MIDQHRPLTFALQLPSHPVSVAAARGVVGSLRPVLSAEQVQRAQLIISELVTNAIRYGSGDHDEVDVEMVAAGGHLRGWVRDHGPAFTVPRGVPRADQIGGFGLHIVEQLAGDWAVERSGGGNEVRFSV